MYGYKITPHLKNSADIDELRRDSFKFLPEMTMYIYYV